VRVLMTAMLDPSVPILSRQAYLLALAPPSSSTIRRLGCEEFHAELTKAGCNARRKRDRDAAISTLAAEHRARLSHMAIQESTLIEYTRCIVTMEDELSEFSFDFVSLDLFIIFIGSLERSGASFSTASKYQAALLHFQQGCNYGLLPGQAPWASRSNPVIKRIFDGYAYKAGAAPARDISSTGPITLERFEELSAWVKKQSPIDQTDLSLLGGLRIIILAALRQIEVRTAKCKHYNPHTRMLTIVADKRDNAHTAIGGHQPTRRKWICMQEAHAWFEHRKGTARDEDYLFDPSRYKVRLLADLIKRASAALCWPPELRWSLHGTRHGGDQEIARAFEPTIARAEADLRLINGDTPDPSFLRAVAAASAALKNSLQADAMQQSASTRARYLMPVSSRMRRQ